MVPALINPSAPVIALLAGLAGVCGAGLLPAANGLFVQALPVGYRARAFGVMQTGLQLLQGASVLVTGVLAGWFPLPLVVGWWSLGGVLLLLVVVSRWWPSPSVFSDVIASTQAANAVAMAAARIDETPAAAPSTPNATPAAPAQSSPAAVPPAQRSTEDPADGRIRTAESM
jgi:MFS family permease